MKQLIIFLINFWMVFLVQGDDYIYPYHNFKERDPLKPLINSNGQILIKEERELGDLELQGILYSQINSKAVINNEIFTEGDIIAGYTIKKIEYDRIILEKGGESYILTLEANK